MSHADPLTLSSQNPTRRKNKLKKKKDELLCVSEVYLIRKCEEESESCFFVNNTFFSFPIPGDTEGTERCGQS